MNNFTEAENTMAEKIRKESRERTRAFFQKLNRALRMPPKMTVSEWADRYRKLSPESSSEPGAWRTSRAEYQREIMDAVSDPKVFEIVLKTSAQVGKTEIINNVIGYHIDCDPGPMLYVMPTDTMAETYSKDRLAPMIRDCPTLRDKVRDSKGRDSGNTILHKKFMGGHITMIGANAPSQLASRPIRIVLLDEIDRFPVSAGSEGDPMQLAIKRTTTFWNRKIIAVSTPTIKGASKIDAEYEGSTQEELYIQCPHCGEYQPYVWEQLKFEHESGTLSFSDVRYACKFCGVLEREVVWKRQKIKWVAGKPENEGKRGFHLNELASPWKTWDEIVQDFLEAKRQGKEMMKVFHNTSLGLSWEEEGDLDMDELLLKRRQYYNCIVPVGVVILTAGVDVQDNRLEYEIVGWGVGKISWGIQYGVIMGDPGKTETWDQLSAVLFDTYKREDGTDLQVLTTCIDSGGHYTSEVYQYCRKNEARRVWAIKGQGGSGTVYIQRPKRRNDAGVWLFHIGVDAGKDTIASRLNTKFESEPGFCHFPMEEGRGYDEQYFQGLTAERRVIRYVKSRAVISWEKITSGARNEPFDIRNYATAALEIANPNLEYLAKHGTEAETRKPAKTKKQRRGVQIW